MINLKIKGNNRPTVFLSFKQAFFVSFSLSNCLTLSTPCQQTIGERQLQRILLCRPRFDTGSQVIILFVFIYVDTIKHVHCCRLMLINCFNQQIILYCVKNECFMGWSLDIIIVLKE